MIIIVTSMYYRKEAAIQLRERQRLEREHKQQVILW